jgi:glucose/arabinose dehydrogenase
MSRNGRRNRRCLRSTAIVPGCSTTNSSLGFRGAFATYTGESKVPMDRKPTPPAPATARESPPARPSASATPSTDPAATTRNPLPTVAAITGSVARGTRGISCSGPIVPRFLLAAVCLLLVASIAACGGDDEEPEEQEPPTERAEPGPEPPAPDGDRDQGARLDFDDVETVAEGLEAPWAFAFVDSDTILVTERAGRVRVIRDGRLRDEPVAELEVDASGEGGLMGIALHPDFPERRVGFLYYTAGGENRLSRFRVGGDLRLTGEVTLLTVPAGPVHDGGRIDFGPDGLLYVSTGETGSPDLAVDRDSLAGKILRVQTNGDPAADNPFNSPVFSFGHRNPQGFDWDSEGRMYASEHGPTGEAGLCCHDEVNLIERGQFYGWPVFAGEADAVGGEAPRESIFPIVESGEETWAPSGLAVHQGADGRTELLVAQLAGERLMRVVLERGEGREVARTGTALDGFGRMRAVDVGPDGCLYATTSNTDLYGDPRAGDDRLLRICERG